MFRIRYFILYSFLSISVLFNAQQLELGEIFNEGIVLQREVKTAVWGNAKPSEEVVVEILGKKHSTFADAGGKWLLYLTPMKAGGPYSMKVISGTQIVQLNEIYAGEVWIAGGQSNMAWTLEKSVGGNEAVASAKNKNIRFVMVPVVNYTGEKVKGDMNWRTATTENAGPMSGIAYFFAKKLQEKLQVPVGVICCYKGGTAAEVWMSREKLLSNSDHAPIVNNYEEYINKTGATAYQQSFDDYRIKLRQYFDSVKAGFTAVRPVEPMGERHYKRPYGLYNTMLTRIHPYTVRGVIWYQGEANAPRAEQYQSLFPALIDEWRSDFKNPDMPFYFVQLSNYDHPAYGVKPAWAELREAQLKTWQTVKNTAMAVSIDVGNKHDIHPTDKKPVGDRLAACALNQLYKFKVPFSGPVYKSMKVKGNKIELSFDYIYSGLKATGELSGFSICGKDQQFVPASAIIQGKKVIVFSDKLTDPVAVRYGWSNWSEGNLFNVEGFPATPFRTGDFQMFTN